MEEAPKAEEKVYDSAGSDDHVETQELETFLSTMLIDPNRTYWSETFRDRQQELIKYMKIKAGKEEKEAQEGKEEVLSLERTEPLVKGTLFRGRFRLSLLIGFTRCR